MMEYCTTECFSVGPPPDSIAHMPPPPPPSMAAALAAAGSCSTGAGWCAPQAAPPGPPPPPFPGVEYRELPRHDASLGDDTWLLVLVTCCVAALFLAALLALFLLKCRDENANVKQAAVTAGGAPGGASLDSRVLWAALTPRGTRHFVADAAYPTECSEQYPEDNQYETIEAMHYKAQTDIFSKTNSIEKINFENGGFLEYDYEDPAPLIENYRMEDVERYRDYDANPYCVSPLSGGGAAGEGRTRRPLVSSPTRIEHPNLPPLNMYPTHRPAPLTAATLRRPGHSRRVSDTDSFVRGAPIGLPI